MRTVLTGNARAANSATGPNVAARLAAPGRWEIFEAELPVPGENEVRIRLEGCGVCGSNLPVYEGGTSLRYPMPPGAPGHEAWGVVDACGPGVCGLRPRDRVAALSYHAFAQYDVASADHCVRLPPELAGKPFPGEPLACAWNVFRRCAIEPGHSVAVVGVGFLGAVLVALLASAGARVTAISRRRSALEMAERYGAERTLFFERAAALGPVLDYAIEAGGAADTLQLCSDLVRVRGKLVIAGYHQDGPRQINLQEWNWKGIDVINAHERDASVCVQGMREAVHAVAGGALDPFPLYTHELELAEIGDAFDLALQRPDGFMKALVRT